MIINVYLYYKYIPQNNLLNDIKKETEKDKNVVEIF